MSVPPTAGIAAAWSATKPSPNDQPVQAAQDRQQTGPAPKEASGEAERGPPAPDGQGTRIDIRV